MKFYAVSFFISTVWMSPRDSDMFSCKSIYLKIFHMSFTSFYYVHFIKRKFCMISVLLNFRCMFTLWYYNLISLMNFSLCFEKNVYSVVVCGVFRKCHVTFRWLIVFLRSFIYILIKFYFAQFCWFVRGSFEVS